MKKFEYLAFEEGTLLYGIPIAQIDMMSNSKLDEVQPIEKWLGSAVAPSGQRRVVRIRSTGYDVSVTQIKGIFRCLTEEIWPIPELIMSHRGNRLLWGVCRFPDDHNRLVLLLDLDSKEMAA